MTIEKMTGRYDWMILQRGKMVLSVKGFHNPFSSHQCTSVLLWPAGEDPNPENTVLTDPCFNDDGYNHASRLLNSFGLSFKDIGQVFITHNHIDHQIHFPKTASSATYTSFQAKKTFSGIEIVPCPGHSPDQKAIVFRSINNEQIWIVGDAILDAEWLKAWMYYWPNNYQTDEIIQTWKSMAMIIAKADIIVPGHGQPFRITHELLSKLLPRLQQYTKVYKYSAHAIEERKEHLDANKSKVLREKRLTLNQRLLLVQGDITTESVDAIVNAANSRLQHRGGIASMISQRGGPVIQTESNKWVQKHGPVSHEEPAYTSGGLLPCRYIIHAVGPKWGSGKEDVKLTEVIIGSLRLADHLGLVSLAFPAISTGIFDFPKELAARVTFAAYLEYFRLYPASGIKEVRLILFDQPIIETFLSVWDETIEESYGIQPIEPVLELPLILYGPVNQSEKGEAIVFFHGKLKGSDVERPALHCGPLMQAIVSISNKQIIMPEFHELYPRIPEEAISLGLGPIASSILKSAEACGPYPDGLILIAYSYGCNILSKLLQTALGNKVKRIVMIAPVIDNKIKKFWPDILSEMPTLIIWGTNDNFVKNPDELVKWFPKANLVPIIGGNHFYYMLPSPLDRFDENPASISRENQCDRVADEIGHWLGVHCLGSDRLVTIVEKKGSSELNLTDEYFSKLETSKTEFKNYDHAFLQKWSQESQI